MSRVFQNIDPPPPSPSGECEPGPAFVGGGGRTHSPGGRGGGGPIFWKTRDIGLPSYSNNLSTHRLMHKNMVNFLIRVKMWPYHRLYSPRWPQQGGGRARGWPGCSRTAPSPPSAGSRCKTEAWLKGTIRHCFRRLKGEVCWPRFYFRKVLWFTARTAVEIKI